MDIFKWLEQFSSAWEQHDVDAVFNLFSPDAVYFESPFLRIENTEAFRKEWENIKTQSGIELSYSIYNSTGEWNSVLWDLKYLDANKQEKKFSGIWLITLNEANKCSYFYQVCMAPV